MRPGLIPRSIAVILQNTLVESVKPGDDVMLTGTLIQRWMQTPSSSGTRPLVDLALKVNNVEVLNKRDFQRGNQISSECLNDFKRFWKKHDLIQGTQILLDSVCENIFERYDVKLGLLLSLIGGVS